MEKAKFELTNILKQNAWGIVITFAVLVSNYGLLTFKTDEQTKTITDHEQRIRAIEIKQEMIMERLTNIHDDTRFLRQQFEERNQNDTRSW